MKTRICEGRAGAVRRGAVFAAAFLALFALGPLARTQYPPPPYPYPPPPPTPIGPTVGASLRNAVNATLNQSAIARRAAGDWGRRANSAAATSPLPRGGRRESQSPWTHTGPAGRGTSTGGVRLLGVVA